MSDQQSYREIWIEIENAAKTAEEKRCVGEAEENATASAQDDGFEMHSEDWFRMALDTYEFLMDAGTYA